MYSKKLFLKLKIIAKNWWKMLNNSVNVNILLTIDKTYLKNSRKLLDVAEYCIILLKMLKI